MSSAPTIRFDQLGKSYRIGHQQSVDTLRDQLTVGVKGIWRRLRQRRETSETFWALRGLCGEFHAGDVVGIIGRNGAGKSTLLKLLSRIAEPTEGTIQLRGRLASLLEVGTGFHPELSGRENIFLNGAVLGMSRFEIQRKFDEIVEFAEVARFLDTPVKRYSSGMYVRLAFAVAAHLEPEILIVDEVLAVGDAQFQQKCLGKMEAVASGEGRTVLFVSHNLDSVARLCSRGYLLADGKLIVDDKVETALARYQNDSDTGLVPGNTVILPPTESQPRFKSLTLRNRTRPDSSLIATGDAVTFELVVESDREMQVENLAVNLSLPNGKPLINADSEKLNQSLRLRSGENRIALHLAELRLTPGLYPVNLWLANTRARDYFHSVTHGIMLPLSERPEATGLRPVNDGLWDVEFTVEQT